MPSFSMKKLSKPVTGKVVIDRHTDLNRRERYDAMIARMKQSLEKKSNGKKV